MRTVLVELIGYVLSKALANKSSLAAQVSMLSIHIIFSKRAAPGIKNAIIFT